MKYSNKRSKSKNRRKSKRGGSVKGAKGHYKTRKNLKDLQYKIYKPPIPGHKTKRVIKLTKKYLPEQFVLEKILPNNVKSHSDKSDTVNSGPLLTKCSYEPNEDSSKPRLVGTFKIEVDKTMKGGNGFELTVFPEYNHIQPLRTYYFIIGKLAKDPSTREDLKHHIEDIMRSNTACINLYKIDGTPIEQYDSSKFYYIPKIKQSGDIYIDIKLKGSGGVLSHLTYHNDTKKKNLNSSISNRGKTHVIANSSDLFVGLEWRLCASYECKPTTSKAISYEDEKVMYDLEYEIFEDNDGGLVKTCLRNIAGGMGDFLKNYFINNIRNLTEYHHEVYGEKMYLVNRLSNLCYDITEDYRTKPGRPAIRRKAGRRSHKQYGLARPPDLISNWNWVVKDIIEKKTVDVRKDTNDLTANEKQELNEMYALKEALERETMEKKIIDDIEINKNEEEVEVKLNQDQVPIPMELQDLPKPKKSKGKPFNPFAGIGKKNK